MIALLILALMVGAALGVIFMGMVAGSRRAAQCQACRREISAEPEWRDGTE